MKKLYNVLLTIIVSILYLTVVALWISIPEELTLNVAVTTLAAVLTLVLLFLNREALSKYYQSYFFKRLQESFVFFALVFGILGLANYWAYKHPRQIDLSVIKINSLSDQTKKVLKELDGELKFKMFARKTDSLVWMTLLEFYRTEKNSIEIEKIDIDVRPDLVGDYQITDAATLVIEYQGKRQKVTVRDELNITNALIRISRPSDPVVYYVEGHGEGDINSPENEGFKLIIEAARNSALDVRPVNLLATSEIPYDAKALILWGPKRALQNSEIQTLKKYVERDGNLLIALDPDLNGDKNPALRDFIKQFKIDIANDLVVDKKKFVSGSNGSIPLVDHYDHDHELTKDFKGQTFFPLTSSLEKIADEAMPSAKGETTILLFSESFPFSWAEKNLTEVINQDVAYTPKVDVPGPIGLAATYEEGKKRVVVFGNSTFVINAYAKYGANFALFLNSLSWVVGENRLISFNLPVVQSEPVFISAPQLGIIFYFSVLFMPLILFGLAIYMYRRKRNK